MKKLLLLVLSIAILVFIVACEQGQTPEHTHSFGEWSVTKNSTCTEDGVKVRYCDCGEKQTESIPATGEHTEVVDTAVTPTCSETGLTEGSHCSVCGTVLVTQAVVPTIAHTYGDWVITKNPNCGEGEMTRYCDCGDKQTDVIFGTGSHIEIIDYAVDPTCSETGLTEGKHCSYCGTILVRQEIVPTVDHVYNTTYSFDNSYHWYACKNCGTKKDSAEHQVADDGMCSVCDQPIGATEGIIYDKSSDGTYAEVVGYTGTAKKIKIADTYQGLPVTTIYSRSFYANETITSVIIPDSVTSIGDSAFQSCSSLTSVVIPDSVTSIGDSAFYGCNSLTYVVIGDSVTSIGDEAFRYCSSLTYVVIGDSVTSIGSGAFLYCSSLTSVVIGNGVTSIGSSAFEYCSSLTSVVIGDSVISIGGWAFSYCSSLTSVVIPDSVTSIGSNAFQSCSSLQFNEYEYCTYLGNNNNPYFALIEVATQNLSCYTIHKDTKIIADCAFINCTRLTSIVIPDSVTTIGSGAFSYCSSLTSVVIPDSVTSIGSETFYDCSSLTSVVIGDSVTSIGDWAFYGCNSLTSVVIGDSVTSIGDWAFQSCSNLRDIYYTGSEEEWKAISIGSSNSELTNATIIYNYVPEN